MLIRLNKIKEINVIELLIIFSTGFLFLADNKQSGFPFIRELYIISLLMYFLFGFIRGRYRFNSTGELWVIFILFSFLIVSPLLAYLRWGQPIYFGMLEERRVLFALIFFPVYYSLKSGLLTEGKLCDLLILGFVLTISVAWLYYFKILTPRLSLDYQVGGTIFDNIEDIYDGFRASRFRLGDTHVIFVFTIMLYSLKLELTKSRNIFNKRICTIFLFILYTVAYVWFVNQTRTLMLHIFIIAIIAYFKQLPKLTPIILFLFIIGFFLYAFGFLDSEVEKFYSLISDITEHTGPRTRQITIDIIMNEISTNFIGAGSLSLQWKDGFARVYNAHFYLSDVGMLGIYYRFGIFFPFIYYVFYAQLIRLCFKIKSNGNVMVNACKIYVIIEIINFPVSNILFSGASVFGVIGAFLLYKVISLEECGVDKKNIIHI
jgi:hypothetical protein